MKPALCINLKFAEGKKNLFLQTLLIANEKTRPILIFLFETYEVRNVKHN